MFRSSLFVFALVFAGCGLPGTNKLPEDAYQAQADIVVAMAVVTATDSATVAPDDGKPDRKVGDKCDNCDGTGRSGDGLGRCNVCKGDGRIDREDLQPTLTTPGPVVPPKTETLPSIELHVSQETAEDWIPWWQNERPYFERCGVKVAYVKETNGQSWLKVCGKTCARIDGQPTREQLIEVIRRVR